MASYIADRFQVPPKIDIQTLRNKDDKVCVVSIVGKSSYNTHQSKASILNSLLNRDVFMGCIEDENKNCLSLDETCQIEGYYDADSHTIYLHLQSAHDTSTLSNMCLHLHQQLVTMGFHSYWHSAENAYARAILYLFNISHILLFSHPGSSFDISYVRLFRILDSIRLKLLPSMGDQLRGLPISKEWLLAGRPCSPRVLFVFEGCAIDLATTESDTVVLSKSRSQKTPPIKRLQHAIEDQIYRILRKSRIITNISNNSLFAVPANQEFVYVCDRKSDMADPVNYYLTQLTNNCSLARDSDIPRSRSYQTNRRTNQSGGTVGTSVNDVSSRSSGSSSKLTETHTFPEFLWQHVELALGKGFDDNFGRNPVQAVFELPTCETWFKVCSKMYNLFMVEQKDTRARPHFNTLESLLDIDSRFSEGRCSKVLPLAESTYHDGLPQHYTKSYHINKLAQAKRVLAQHARGPACQKYMSQLEEDCENVWRNGRQLCEERSLTGNHCVNELHRTPDQEETEENQHLPSMLHSSQIKTKAACNCGAKQAEREDPFDHKAANYEFYERLEENCCSRLEKLELPVFAPSTTDIKAAGLVTKASVVPPSPKVPPLVRKDSTKLVSDLAPGMSNLSLALSLGQSGGSDTFSPRGQGSFNMDLPSPKKPETSQDRESHEEEESHDHDESHDHELEAVQEESHDQDQEQESESREIAAEIEEVKTRVPEEKKPVRQHSTTEYLPSMVHSESPPGLLPKFPSWSIVSLAKYNTYHPNQGLDLPGFLHGTNYLLSWDVTVRGDREKWPTLMDTSSKKSKSKKGQKVPPQAVSSLDPSGLRRIQALRGTVPEAGELKLRLYVGFEYECPRGHRFMCSAPDKIHKTSGTGAVKETAHKVMTSDMPLYFPCHCRSSKGYMGQLMRVLIAIPEGLVQVKLDARVQPGPPPCPIFMPSPDGAIMLPAGNIWVLRLPYIYLGNNGPYLMPSDPQHLPACRLMQGIFNIVDTTAQT